LFRGRPPGGGMRWSALCCVCCVAACGGRGQTTAGRQPDAAGERASVNEDTGSGTGGDAGDEGGRDAGGGVADTGAAVDTGATAADARDPASPVTASC